jgi:hypothetical protein
MGSRQWAVEDTQYWTCLDSDIVVDAEQGGRGKLETRAGIPPRFGLLLGYFLVKLGPWLYKQGKDKAKWHKVNQSGHWPSQGQVTANRLHDVTSFGPGHLMTSRYCFAELANSHNFDGKPLLFYIGST